MDKNASKIVFGPIVDLVNMGTDLAYWLLLDFFVLEMKAVKDLISAETKA